MTIKRGISEPVNSLLKTQIAVCIDLFYRVKVTKRRRSDLSNEVKSKFSSLECDLTSNFIPTPGR